MKKVTKERASTYRQEIYRKVEQLKELCLKAGYPDLLFGGSPIEVYRTCGKKNCKCQEGGEKRHGPYQAIQVCREGKQRHITLKKDESDFFNMAKHYQYQMQNRRRVISTQEDILRKLDEMLEARVIWDKK